MYFFARFSIFSIVQCILSNAQCTLYSRCESFVFVKALFAWIAGMKCACVEGEGLITKHEAKKTGATKSTNYSLPILALNQNMSNQRFHSFTASV